jgi:hypothetical protein
MWLLGYVETMWFRPTETIRIIASALSELGALKPTGFWNAGTPRRSQ